MKYLKMMSLLVLAMVMSNCGSDDPPAAPVAEFFSDVNGTEVTFNSNVTNASTITWSFGDGSSSTEADPVHAYATPGNYTVTLTAQGEGGTDTDTQTVEILESLDYLLSGGAAKPEGKTWKLKYEVSPGFDKEGVGFVENTLSILIPQDEDGLLDWIELSQGYDDSFTFVYDGSYKLNNADGASLMALIYANIAHQGSIVAVSSEPDLVPVADVTYSPKEDATWSLNSEPLTIDAINPASGTVESVTFTGKTQLVIDEYFGFKDASTVVLIKEVSETTLTVAIGIHAALSAHEYPTHMLHMSFEAQP